MDLQYTESDNLSKSVSTLLPSKQVTFRESTDVSVTLEDTSLSVDNTTKQSRKPSIISLGDLKLINYRLAVGFGICFIAMLFLSPIVLYYIEHNTSGAPPTKDIGNINISQVYRMQFVFMHVSMYDFIVDNACTVASYV